MTRPETQYVRSGDGWVAYQVSGDGPIDIFLWSGVTMPIDSHHDLPAFAKFLDRLGSFARVIRHDRLGVGLSDAAPPLGPMTLERWADDALAVRDAVGSEVATLMSTDGSGGQPALLTAATHPSRVSSLVLMHPTPCPTTKEDWPFGIGIGADEFLDRIEQRWVRGTAPSQDVLDDATLAWLRRSQRRGAGPKGARAVFQAWVDTDVRHLVPSVTQPTLVLDRPGASAGAGSHEAVRWTAENIPGARFVELPGVTPFIFSDDVDATLAEIEEFLTGTRPFPLSDDRIFAALLFTDIVSSTQRMSAAGDGAWRAVLDEHDAIVRSNLEHYRGRLVNPTGDGMLATFDGPARAVGCARSITEAVRAIGLDVRAGIHAGEVVARGDDVTGIAVSIARRVSDLGSAGEILVSRTVTDLVAGSGLEFEDRGEHELKGVPNRWQLYAVKTTTRAPGALSV